MEAEVRRVIQEALQGFAGTVEIKRILLANALKPLPGNKALVEALQKHRGEVFGEPIPSSGTPLYTDVRLYGEHGVGIARQASR